MNSLTILAALTIVSAAWATRALYLDARRQRRNYLRARADLAAVIAERDELIADLEMAIDFMVDDAQRRHPAGCGLRAVK